jgi:hypothetical protein
MLLGKQMAMPPHQPFDDGGGAFIVGEFIPSNRFAIIIPQSLHKL